MHYLVYLEHYPLLIVVFGQSINLVSGDYYGILHVSLSHSHSLILSKQPILLTLP